MDKINSKSTTHVVSNVALPKAKTPLYLEQEVAVLPQSIHNSHRGDQLPDQKGNLPIVEDLIVEPH